jgi:hypothetical protein
VIGHFVRRLFGGVVTVLWMLFIVHSLLHLYLRESPMETRLLSRSGHCGCPNTGVLDYLVKYYHLDRPFPTGYLLWMFDPSASNAGAIDYGADYKVGVVSVDIFGYHLRGTGILAGDFGRSIGVQKRAAALDLSSIDVVDLLARLFVPGMALAILQRVGHKPYSHLPYRPRVVMRDYLLGISSSRAL